MRQKRRGQSRSWTRNGAAGTVRPPTDGTEPNPTDSAEEARLGPYEARYDIAFGYGTERSITSG